MSQRSPAASPSQMPLSDSFRLKNTVTDEGASRNEHPLVEAAGIEPLRHTLHTIASSGSHQPLAQRKGRTDTGMSADSAAPSISNGQARALENMKTLIFHTERSVKDDPEADIAGIWYVFTLLCMGTMSWVNRAVAGTTKRLHVLRFVVHCLRGVGQVYFMNNPISGLLIVVALFIQSPRVAAYGMLGLVGSNLFANLMGFDRGLHASGLFGYNGVLCGLALATFSAEREWDAVLFTIVIVTSWTSAVLFVSLGRLLVPYKVPPFTLPFNLALLVFLLASANMLRIHQQPVSTPRLPGYESADSVQMPSVAAVVEASFKGVGQVFLADKTLSGALITLGLCVCSPFAAAAALCGSLVGNLFALLIGSDSAAIAAGLYGYNASLSFVQLFGMFYAPSITSFILGAFSSCLSVVLQDCVAAFFAPYGLPAATVPFCLCALVFQLLQGATTKVMPVPLASMTVPEDHNQRANAIKRTYRLLAALILKDDRGLETAFARYIKLAAVETEQKKKRLEQTGDSVHERHAWIVKKRLDGLQTNWHVIEVDCAQHEMINKSIEQVERGGTCTSKNDIKTVNATAADHVPPTLTESQMLDGCLTLTRIRLDTIAEIVAGGGDIEEGPGGWMVEISFNTAQKPYELEFLTKAERDRFATVLARAKTRRDPLSDVFFGLDADGSGTLDRDEFGALVQAAGLAPWRRDFLLDVFDQMVHPIALDMLMTPCTVFCILCIHTHHQTFCMFRCPVPRHKVLPWPHAGAPDRGDGIQIKQGCCYVAGAIARRTRQPRRRGRAQTGWLACVPGDVDGGLQAQGRHQDLLRLCRH